MASPGIWWTLASSIFLLLEFMGAIQFQSQVSTDLATSICDQMTVHQQSGQLQPPVKRRPRPMSQSSCGWHSFGQCRSGQCRYESYKACDNGPRIVGGKDVDPPNKFPSMTYFKHSRVQVPICGATIIDKNWALTAGHCVIFPPPDGYDLLVAGDHNWKKIEGTEQETKILEQIRHPDHMTPGGSQSNDIGLLRFDSLTFNEYVQPVVLPEPHYRVDGSVTAVGWGSIIEDEQGPDILQEVDLSVISDEECQKLYTHLNVSILENQLCALELGKDTCGGDSGGPLYKIKDGKHILAGITSWGDGCGEKDKPGVYTEVAYFIPWIRETMRKYSAEN